MCLLSLADHWSRAFCVSSSINWFHWIKEYKKIILIMYLWIRSFWVKFSKSIIIRKTYLQGSSSHAWFLLQIWRFSQSLWVLHLVLKQYPSLHSNPGRQFTPAKFSTYYHSLSYCFTTILAWNGFDLRRFCTSFKLHL